MTDENRAAAVPCCGHCAEYVRQMQEIFDQLTDALKRQSAQMKATNDLLAALSGEQQEHISRGGH